MLNTFFSKMIHSRHEPLQGYIKKLISASVGMAGIYLAMFWIADAKYGNAISRLKSRTTNLVTRLESDQWRKAIALVPSLQNRKIPLKPNFFNVPSVVKSLRSSYDEVDLEVIGELQDLVISKKNDLNNLDLKSVVLEKSDFSGLNLANSILENSSLKYSSFTNSNFRNTYLNNSFLEHVDFTNSEFQGAVLNDSNMEGYILAKAKLLGAKLENVNLSNSDLSSCNLHLSNLKGAKLHNSNLSQSNLVGVDFENAKGLDQANLRLRKM